MSAGRSESRRTHSANRQTPHEHAGPSCLNCARLEGENRALRITLDRLIAHAIPGNTTTVVAQPTPPEAPDSTGAKPLPKPVQLAIVRQFPGRTRERAVQESMARDLIDAGEEPGAVAEMIANGRPIEL